MPGTLSWRPATASVPVASMVWIGFQRPPHSPDCGPRRSSGMPSANTLPMRINPAARTMSAGATWLSVPIWSSLPQRPQFLSFSVASAIAFLPTLMFIATFPSIRDGILGRFRNVGRARREDFGRAFPRKRKASAHAKAARLAGRRLRLGVGELRDRGGSGLRLLRFQGRRNRILDALEPDELHLAARGLG